MALQQLPLQWGRDRSIAELTFAEPGIRAAIEAVRPWAVDASSRLEVVPGVKDPERVRAFVEAAQ